MESRKYTAVIFGSRCQQLGIDVSIGSIGDCYDNAVCEAFHSTLKRELVHRRPWPTRAELKTAVFAYIEGFYNTRRRHSTLNHYSPVGVRVSPRHRVTLTLTHLSTLGS